MLQKLSRLVKLYKNLMYTPEGTFFIQSSSTLQNVNPHKIYVKIETGSCWIKNEVTRSKLIKKPCVHSRGHSLDPKFLKLCQNVNIHISRTNLKLGHILSKTRLLGQILERHCVHS